MIKEEHGRTELATNYASLVILESRFSDEELADLTDQELDELYSFLSSAKSVAAKAARATVNGGKALSKSAIRSSKAVTRRLTQGSKTTRLLGGRKRLLKIAKSTAGGYVAGVVGGRLLTATKRAENKDIKKRIRNGTATEADKAKYSANRRSMARTRAMTRLGGAAAGGGLAAYKTHDAGRLALQKRVLLGS